MNLLILIFSIVYPFVAIAYGRYVYKRHTWKFGSGDEIPSAVFFGIFWPVGMLVQVALLVGDSFHSNSSKK